MLGEGPGSFSKGEAVGYSPLDLIKGRLGQITLQGPAAQHIQAVAAGFKYFHSCPILEAF